MADRTTHTPQPRRKHLMDPNNLQAHRSDPMSLSQVQKWVLSTLAVTTILHMAAGVVIAAAFVEPERVGARIGLLVIAGLFGVMAVAAGLVIHQRKPWSWWLLLGWLPALVGAWVIL